MPNVSYFLYSLISANADSNNNNNTLIYYVMESQNQCMSYGL